MTFDEREKLRRLIAEFENTTELCCVCRVLAEYNELCPDCLELYERAKEYEDAHCKFTLNDTEIVTGFKQSTGKEMDEEELATFKDLMLQFECEDADNIVEAIRKVVMSLQMHEIEGWDQ